MTTTMSTDPGGTATIAVDGDLDARAALDVGILVGLAEVPSLRLDVSSVGRVHADGLSTLMVVMRRAHRSGCDVSIYGARPAVALVLSTTGILAPQGEEGGPAATA
ncbi:MAG TPA: STAS domain-containing protein [Acidimicrobiales bacterium]|nr:STAS domain-containing protein [Acidimicrobiales bacterium]